MGWLLGAGRGVMWQIFDGFGFAVRIVVLLFTWLAVAMFVSRELAAVMGLLVIGLWLFFFIPLNYIREVAWQSRQKKIMDTALAHSPPQPYHPGSALPPPTAGGLLIPNPSAGGGALDVYRDLPSLPDLEPRTHAQGFRRALALPVVGLLMFLGAENDTFMHMLLEARGITSKPPVAFDSIIIPAAVQAEFADRRLEMEAAARMTLRREPSCVIITGGQVEAVPQFASGSEQIAAIRDGRYVYVFTCETRRDKGETFTTWIGPDELDPGKLASLMNTLDPAPPIEKARPACVSAANALLAPINSRLVGAESVTVLRYDNAGSPYSGYGYLVSQEQVVRANGAVTTLTLSCWVDQNGEARVRFLR